MGKVTSPLTRPPRLLMQQPGQSDLLNSTFLFQTRTSHQRKSFSTSHCFYVLSSLCVTCTSPTKCAQTFWGFFFLFVYLILEKENQCDVYVYRNLNNLTELILIRNCINYYAIKYSENQPIWNLWEAFRRTKGSILYPFIIF